MRHVTSGPRARSPFLCMSASVAGAVKNFAPDRMWATALTLIILVVLLNVVARLVGRLNKLQK